MAGTIARVFIEKGFGFIRIPGEDDCFFHCKELAPELEWSETLIERRVAFDALDTHRGATGSAD